MSRVGVVLAICCALAEHGLAEPAEPADLASTQTRSGALVEARMDGNHWDGFALGLGVVLRASERFSVQLEGMKSDIYGIYLGARYSFLVGRLRPYVGVGLPLMFFTDDADNDQITVGGRLAAGLEIAVTRRISAQIELGAEHYFNVAGVIYKGKTFEPTEFAPSLGLIGRL